MEKETLDLDLLATHLRVRMEQRKLSLRAAAQEIGCSPATLSRLLQGAKVDIVPDSNTLLRASSWVGKMLDDFTRGGPKQTVTVADVEVHLRALPGLSKMDAEALVAMVKAAYEASAKKRPKR